MAHSLYILYSGGSVDLNSGNIRMLTQYVPRMGDGVSVTDSVELEFSGTSATDIQTAAQSVQKAMADAVRLTLNKSNAADKVYLHYKPEGIAKAYRTELMPASTKEWRLELDEDSLGKARWEDAFKVKGLLVWKRADWWEDASSYYLPLANVGGTFTAGTVTNHQNEAGTASFYVSISGGSITGDVATPAILHYTNLVNDAAKVGNLYVGQFVEGIKNTTPAPGTLIFEGTASADAGCSGGSYTALSFAGTVEASMISWTIPATNAYEGHRYKFIARFKDSFAFTDLYLKAKYEIGGAVLAETRWQLAAANEQLQVIGSMKLPPMRGTYTGGSVALYSKRAGGAGTVNFDYMAAIPQDGWRTYAPIGGLGYNQKLYDDPGNESLYTADLTTSEFTKTHYASEGEPVKLVPGVDNTLYFLHETTGGTADITRTAEIKIAYRPRRRLI